MMSMCPLVTGSNDPGQAASAHRAPPHGSRSGQRWAARPYQSVVSPYLRTRSPGTRRARSAPGRGPDALHDDQRLGRQPAVVAQAGEHRRDVVDGHGVRRVEEDHVVRPRLAAPPRAALDRHRRTWTRACAERRDVRPDQGGGRAGRARRAVTTPAPRLSGLEPDARRTRRRGRGRGSPAATPSRARGRRTAPRGPGRDVGRVLSPGGAWIRRPPARAGDDAGHAGHASLQVVGLLGRRAGGDVLGQRPGARRASGRRRRARWRPRGPAAMTSSSRSTRSSRRLERPPGLGGAEHVALAALLEVEPGQLEPVGGRGDRVQPLPGRGAGCGLGDQQAQPGRPPRPTRPRSWCSWETPNRSASRTTIIVALGTSTPTSITVVETSTSTSPAANARITSSLSPAASGRAASRPAAPQRPARRRSARHRRHGAARAGAGRRPGSPRRRSSPAPRRGGPAGLAGLVVADPRADDVRLVPLATSSRTRCQARSSQRGFSAAGTTCEAIGDRPARQLGERRGLQVAEHGHRHGPRDRRGRHHQHVRRHGLPLLRSASRCSTPNRCCSSTTTRPRSGNVHVLLDQRVGADHDAGVAARRRPAGPARAGGGRLRPGEQRDLGADRRSRRACRPRRGRRAWRVMERWCCCGEDLGGRQQRGLAAGVDDRQHRPQRDDRLARADLALQQPVHRVLAGQLAGDLLADVALARGQLERQPLRRSVEQTAADADGAAWCRTSSLARRRWASTVCSDERLVVAQPVLAAGDVPAVPGRWTSR